MNKDRLGQLLILGAVVATLAVNVLANTLPLNGLLTAEISDRFRVYFTPAGYVFSIWGLIYLGLIGYAIYQARPDRRHNPRLRSIRTLFLVSSLANIAWIFCWHFLLFPLALLAMFVLLAALIGIYLRLRIGRSHPSLLEIFLVDVPFSLYLGWITVATIANVTSFLDYLRWGGFGVTPERWLVIVLALASVVGTLVTLKRRDVVFVLVLAWAFAGIGVKHAGVNTVAAAAWVAAGYALALAVVNVPRMVRARNGPI